MIMSFVAVGLGAAVGAWSRWGLSIFLNQVHSHLPLGTLVANWGGGLIIGLALAFFDVHPGIAPEWRLFLVTRHARCANDLFHFFSGSDIATATRRISVGPGSLLFASVRLNPLLHHRLCGVPCAHQLSGFFGVFLPFARVAEWPERACALM